MAIRMNRDLSEVFVGGLALVAFAGFVAFAFTVNQRAVSGYPLQARYNHIDGLELHADVRLAGIRIGEVVGESLDPMTDQAVVTMTIASGVEIPVDSAAIIATEGILGAKFIKIDPGGDEKSLKPGSAFDYVQDSVDFMHLLELVVEQAEARRAAAQRPSVN